MRGVIAASWQAGATASIPALRVMLHRRAARGKEDQARLPEREGRDATPRPAGRLLWLHAASVGEAVSVLPVLSSLAASAPAVNTIFTTGTVTSARLLEQRLPELALARVLHRFVPLDVPAWRRGSSITGGPTAPPSSRASCGPTCSPHARSDASH